MARGLFATSRTSHSVSFGMQMLMRPLLGGQALARGTERKGVQTSGRGHVVGLVVGCWVGDLVGDLLGDLVGDLLGDSVGDLVGV